MPKSEIKKLVLIQLIVSKCHIVIADVDKILCGTWKSKSNPIPSSVCDKKKH